MAVSAVLTRKEWANVEGEETKYEDGSEGCDNETEAAELVPVGCFGGEICLVLLSSDIRPYTANVLAYT